MKVPTVKVYEFPGCTYLLLDDGEQNEVLMGTYRIKEIEVAVDPEEEGLRKTSETRYQIQKQSFEDLDLEPCRTVDEAIRKTTSEMINGWANQTL